MLTSHIENLEDYDAIFIGYPVWWYTLPQVMLSFFDEYNFSGKVIVPFCTHYGSRSGGTFDRIAELEPPSTVSEGLPCIRTTCRSAGRMYSNGWTAWDFDPSAPGRKIRLLTEATIWDANSKFGYCSGSALVPLAVALLIRCFLKKAFQLSAKLS